MKRDSGNERVTHGGMGVASLLLVIVVVCLTAFGILSLVTARDDRALTQRVMEADTAFWDAQGRTQRILFSLDKAVEETGERPGEAGLIQGAGGTVHAVEEDILVFSVPVDAGRALCAKVRFTSDGYVLLTTTTVFSGEEAEWN